MKRYCELVLYVGRCHADGLPPGRFSPLSEDPYSRKRISDALRTIEKYLLPSQKWGLIIDYDGLVKDNEEADDLADYAKKAFPGAREIIEPHQCIHGKIIFGRKIRFDNCGEEDADGIINGMKRSGHIPNEFTRKADWIRKCHHSREAVRTKLGELEERLDDYWRSALRFY